jgi:signal transduction histidine kinase
MRRFLPDRQLRQQEGTTVATTEFASRGTEPVPVAPGADSIHDSERLRRRLRRLALDIHDGPMQCLVGIGFGLDHLKRRLDDDPDEVAEQLRVMSAELAAAEQSLRDLITTLERSGEEPLDDFETIALAEIASFRLKSTAAVASEITRGTAPDSRSQAIALAAVLREALNNVAKHARASRVTVELHADQDSIDLLVVDDGIGFEPGQTGADRLGLTSMRERVGFLGGRVTIDSRPGGPTAVCAVLPRWRAARAVNG